MTCCSCTIASLSDYPGGVIDAIKRPHPRVCELNKESDAPPRWLDYVMSSLNLGMQHAIAATADLNQSNL